MLIAMPKVVEELPPYLDGLPMLILRLATDIDYEADSVFVEKVADELSWYYAGFVDYFWELEGGKEEVREKIDFIYKNSIFVSMK